jgi:hypothetical protein
MPTQAYKTEQIGRTILRILGLILPAAVALKGHQRPARNKPGWLTAAHEVVEPGAWVGNDDLRRIARIEVKVTWRESSRDLATAISGMGRAVRAKSAKSQASVCTCCVFISPFGRRKEVISTPDTSADS